MSNRKSVLAAIYALGSATCNDIDELSGLGVTKTRFTIGDVKKAGLVIVEKDEVTGQPSYKLSASGNQWLKDNASDTTNATTEESLSAQMPTDKVCCNASAVMATTAGSEIDKLIQRCQDLEAEAADARIIFGILRKTLRLEEGDSIKLGVELLQSDLALQQAATRRQIQRAEAAEQNRNDLKKRIEKLEADQSYREGVIADLNAQLGHARIQIDALNEQLMHGEEAVDVKDAARGYLVCAPKRKPAKLMNAESAVARAKSAAKATGRGEVFALVPVGIATRKQVQAIEFKERAA